MKVMDVMVKGDFTLKEDNTFYDAAELFSNNKIQVVPIINDKEILIGVITKNDIIKNIVKGTGPSILIKYLSLEKKNITSEAEKIGELKKRLDCGNDCGGAILNCSELDAVIEASFDGIYVTDEKANTLKINKSYECITGLNRKDMINKNMYELQNEGFISRSSTLMVLENKKSNTIEQEFSTGKKVMVSSNPIFDEKNNLSMVVTNVRDITELHQLERQIAKNMKITEKYYSEIAAMRSEYLNLLDIIAKDKKMIDLLEVAKRVANVETTVLILGETGTGKEIVAKFIHKNSMRSEKNFIRINCGSIPHNLIESELFGYVKGAFTGANNKGKIGLFEVADGGTIFMDEIGELPLDIQVKLLNVLEEGEVVRVGAVKPIKIDVRVLAATNRNLEKMTKDKSFRADLYYRLSVVPLTVPPLRERREDIIPLVQDFLTKLNIKYNFEKTFTVEALIALYNYDWPGNVRELKNIVERVVVMSTSNKIFKSGLPIKSVQDLLEKNNDHDEICNLKQEVEKVEAKLIMNAFNNAGNVRDAAKLIGINSSTFFRKRKMYLEKKML